MENEMAYELLWQVTQKEKQTNELQLLPRTFYHDIVEFLKGFERQDMSEEDAALRRNTMKMAGELYERRKQKIMIYVAYKKQIVQPAVQQELDFYNKLMELSNKERLDLGTAMKTSTQNMRALQSIPEIILPSGRKAGPFEKNQVVEVNDNEEDIKFLITNTICEKQ